jgi:Ribosomal protein L23
MKDIYQVIKNVRLSEKATMLQETNNEVTLEVDRKANKLEIKQAVEQLFGKTDRSPQGRRIARPRLSDPKNAAPNVTL